MDVRILLITGIAPRLPDSALSQWLLAQDLTAWATAEAEQGYGISSLERPTRLLIAHLARLVAVGDPVESSAAINRLDALTAAGPELVRFDAWVAAWGLRQAGLSDRPVPPRPPPPSANPPKPIPAPPKPPSPRQPPYQGADEF
jgi:hypothetical protein